LKTMTSDLLRTFKRLIQRVRFSGRDIKDFPSASHNVSRDADDEKDIESVLEAFRDLIAQLTEDGKELGQLYARAERKAAHYAVLSETVIESVTSGILVFDRSDRLIFANSSAKRTLGFQPQTGVVGMGLDSLLKDGSELRHLVHHSFENGTNASREIREVVTLAGRCLRLGVSTSCVETGSANVDAVIAVFTSLGDDETPLPEADGEAARALERQSYLRGVLDSYDLIARLFMDFDRIEQKSNSGTLTTCELREFSVSLRRACDTMMAFALSLGVIDSVPELVDVNSVVGNVVNRAGLACDSRLRTGLENGLPEVKTVRKVLEVGLGLLIGGSMSQSQEGVEVTSSLEAEGSQCAVYINVRELSPSKPVRRVGGSLREFIGGGDMQREAGLFLLASLASRGHTLEAGHVDGLFHFSMRIGSPIDKKVGPGGRMGEISDRGRDESV
jgi:PAS domain-containing protein